MWVAVAAVLTGMALAANVALLFLPPTRPWAWSAGAITGGLWAMYLYARDDPPQYIANWLVGSEGEKQTEKTLRPLEREGWRVHHDLAAAYGSGNLDHVVIGPGGVFLLDSKKFGGEVTVDDSQAIVRRLEDRSLSYHYDAGKGVVPLALDVRDRLRKGTRATQYVHAVVVVWGDFPQQVAEGRCTYVHGDHLVAWLRSQPLRVAPNRVEQFSGVLAQVETRAGALDSA